MTLCGSISKIKQDIGQKFWRYVYSFWHDPRTWQTDRQTDTAWRHIPRLCIASHGKNRHFLRTPAFIFCLPWGRPCGNNAKRCINEKTIQCLPNPSQYVPIYLQQFPSNMFIMLHGWKDNSMLAKPLAACTHLSSTVSQLFEPQVQKNRRFYVPRPTFLFPMETPLRLSRNMLHGWKVNSMLVKPLAAYTYLSSIVSELYHA